MHFIKSLLLCSFVLVPALMGVRAFAQEAENSAIYLEVPGQDPPARVSQRKTMKEVYEDKSVRVERDIAKLSDDRIVNDGKFVEYYRDGQKYVEGVYKMGVFDGVWKYWFPNGQLCKAVNFKDGKPDGKWEVFDQDGKQTKQKSYQDGKRHGKWLSYHVDGKTVKLEVSYEQGQAEGERISYYESGNKRQVILFKAGKMDGLMTEWNDQGDKVAELEFKDGVKVGKVVRFDE